MRLKYNSCVSPPLEMSWYVQSYICVTDKKIVSGAELKICGVRFGSKPTVTNQIESIERKFNERASTPRDLKRSGFKKKELKDCYTALIRSGLSLITLP